MSEKIKPFEKRINVYTKEKNFEEGTASKVLIITGMHRSGTSMITRVLNLSGLYLGPNEKLIPPASDNPEGFWEHKELVDINKEILKIFGGGWDFVPIFPKNWENDERLAILKNRAIEIIKEFSLFPIWGWKDPRVSLTLPFWKEIIPNHKILISLLNPLEVALSLKKRNNHSIPFGLHLWMEYNTQLLNNTSPEQRLITHYDVYFFDPISEILRIARWMGWEISEEQLTNIQQVIKTSLRHSRKDINDLIEAQAPDNVIKLYNELLNEAGPVCHEALKKIKNPLETENNQIPVIKTDDKEKYSITKLLQFAEKKIESKDLDNARKILNQILSIQPANVDALNNIAITFVLEGQIEKAIEIFKKIIIINPENPIALENLSKLRNILKNSIELNSTTSDNFIGEEFSSLKTATQNNSLPEPNKKDGISIIIPTHNKKELISQCLKSLNQIEIKVPIEVIVVDNNSSDGTEKELHDLKKNLKFPLKLIKNSKNFPFSRANNQAARKARFDNLLFLNNDTYFKSDFLSRPLELLKKPDIGIVGIKMLFPDGLVQHAGIVFNKRKSPVHIFRFYPHDFPLVNQSREMQAITGACFFIQKDLFQKLGGFDESYVNGYEDIDLCFRVRENGYKVLYTPDVYIYHLESQTSGRLRKVEDNRQFFLNRWGHKIVEDMERYYSEALVNTSVIYKPHSKKLSRQLNFAIKIGVPDRSIQNWGDIYYAQALAKEIRRKGHQCVIHYLNEWDQKDKQIDVVIHLKGLSKYRVKPYNFNILWIINHPELHTPEELNQYDMVLCASKKYYNEIKPLLEVPVYYIPQATDTEHFCPLPDFENQDIDILFIGNNYDAKFGKRRKIIDDLLSSGKDFNLWIIGQGWKGFVDDKYIKGEYIPYEKLPSYYRRAKIVLNDHQDTMREKGFINNRTFDLAHLKVFQISNKVEGIEKLGVVCYNRPEDLHKKIDYFLNHPEKRKEVNEKVFTKCKEFTFQNRAQEIISLIKKHNNVLVKKRKNISRKINDSLLQKPVVSVIMATYNREETLGDAIQSVIDQTFPYWELIIVNDGGRPVKDIIRSFRDPRIKYFDNMHQGKAASLNFAIKRAHGEYIAYLDDDDIFHPNHLHVLISYLDTHKEVKFAYTFSEEVNYIKNDQEWKELNRGAKYNLQISPDQLRFRNYIPNLCAIHKKDLFNQVGLYDESLQVLIDWDMYRRLATIAPPRFIDQLTAEYRRFNTEKNFADGQITGLYKNNPIEYYRNRLRILSKPFLLKKKPLDERMCSIFYLTSLNKNNLQYAIYKYDYISKRYSQIPVLLIDTEIDSEILYLIQYIENRGGFSIWNHKKLPVERFLEEFLKDSWWSKHCVFDSSEVYNQENVEKAISSKESFISFATQLRKNKYLKTITSQNKTSSNKNPQVSIIIPVYNNWDFTQKCLMQLLHENQNQTSFEVIIIDNASTDGTSKKIVELMKKHSNLRLISNNKNTGFAHACNQGAAKANGKYVLFLNNDIEPIGNWLDKMVEIMSIFNNVGAVGAKLLYPDSKTIQHAGVAIDDKPQPIFAYHIYHQKPSNFIPANYIREYQAVTGACMLVPRKIFWEIGGFDEGFINGYEDVDFCFTLRKKGYKVIYTPEAELYHYESKTPGRFKYVEHNVKRLHEKWYGKITKDTPQALLRPEVSIIISTSGESNRLNRCLESIQKNTRISYEIIVVDNGQNIDSLSGRETHNLRWIRNYQGASRVRRFNQGLAVAKGNFIVLLQDDVLVSSQWLKKLLMPFVENEKIGLVSPITNFDFGLQLDLNAPSESIREFISYSKKIYTRRRFSWQKVSRNSFFCTVIHKKVVDSIGGFDEALEKMDFYEDDYCLRVKLSGFTSIIAHDVFVYRNQSQKDLKRLYFDYISERKKHALVFKQKWGCFPEQALYDNVEFKRLPQLKIELNKSLLLINAKVLSLPSNQKPIKIPSKHKGYPDNGDLQIKKIKSEDVEVSIIILTFNQLKYTKECLTSIERFTRDVKYEIIVVDNGSTDGTVSFLKKWKKNHKNVQLILNKENKGFAAGNNQGIQKARGNNILLLNNDVVVTQGWLKKMLRAFDKSPNIGIVGPMTNYIRGPQLETQVNYQTEEELQNFSRDYYLKNKEKVVISPMIVGFCMLVRREVFEKVGLLDESFGKGNFEDDDFCLRAILAGYKLAIAKDVFIHHYGNKSFNGNQIDYEESLKNNRKIFIEKWKELKEPIPLWLIHLMEKAKYDEKNGDLQGAHWALNKAFQIAPDNREIVEKYLEFLDKRGSHEEKISVLKGYLSKVPEDVDMLNKLGVQLWHLGQINQAIQFFQKVVAQDGNNPDHIKNLADAYLATERFDEAIQLYMALIQKFPADSEPYEKLANLYVENGDFDSARTLIQKALEYQPENTYLQNKLKLMQIPRLYLGYGFLEQGENHMAEKLFREVLESHPEQLDALMGLGEIAFRQQQWTKAKDIWEQVLSLTPDVIVPVTYLSQIYLNNEDMEGFSRVYDQYASHYAENSRLHLFYVQYLLLKEEFAMALQELNQHLERFPEDADAYLILGDLYASDNRLEEARNFYIIAEKLAPHSEEIRKRLAELESLSMDAIK